jgi:hypothetical protein
MGKLQERIEGRNKARDEASLISALEREYVSQLETIDIYDSVDEKNRRGDVVVNRSIERRQMASRRAVESIIEQIRDCYERTGRTPQEIDDMMWEESIEDFLNPPSTNTDHETPQYEWLQDMNRDLESNFIYTEFGRQLIESDNPVRTYSAYSLYTGAKALVTLLTSVSGGYDLLMKVWRDGYYLDTELYAPGHSERLNPCLLLTPMPVGLPGRLHCEGITCMCLTHHCRMIRNISLIH